MHDLDVLHHRLARLERRVRRGRILTIAALLVALGATAARAGAAPDVVEAREFRLLDAEGRTVGAFHTSEAGAHLTLTAPGGGVEAQLAAGPGLAALQVKSGAGVACIRATRSATGVGVGPNLADSRAALTWAPSLGATIGTSDGQGFATGP